MCWISLMWSSQLRSFREALLMLSLLFRPILPDRLSVTQCGWTRQFTAAAKGASGANVDAQRSPAHCHLQFAPCLCKELELALSSGCWRELLFDCISGITVGVVIGNKEIARIPTTGPRIGVIAFMPDEEQLAMLILGSANWILINADS